MAERTKRLLVSISATEERLLKKKAKAAKFRSLAGYLRHRGLTDPEDLTFDLLHRLMLAVQEQHPDLREQLVPMFERAVDALTAQRDR